MRRVLTGLARLPLFLGLVALELALLPLLLVVARTWQGRVWGFAALLLDFGLVYSVWFLGRLIVGGVPPPASVDGWLLIVLWVGSAWVVALLVPLGILLTRSRPCYHQNPAAGLWSVGPFVPTQRPSRLWATGSPIPETDLVRLAVALHGAGRRGVGKLLAEMDADPGYRELYPVWMQCLGSVAHGRYWFGHFYAYVPPAVEGPLPVVVFLHGHGPNSAVYLHA